MRIIFNVLIFSMSLLAMEEEPIDVSLNPLKIASKIYTPYEYFDQTQKNPHMVPYNFLGFLKFVDNNKTYNFWKNYLFDSMDGDIVNKDYSQTFWQRLLKNIGCTETKEAPLTYNVINLLDQTKHILYTQQNVLNTFFEGSIQSIISECNSALIKILSGAWGIKFKPLSQFTEEEINQYKRIQEISKNIGISAFINRQKPSDLAQEILNATSNVLNNKQLDNDLLKKYHLKLYSKIARSYLSKDYDFVYNVEAFAKNLPYYGKQSINLLLNKDCKLIFDFYNILKKPQVEVSQTQNEKEIWQFFKKFSLESPEIQGKSALNLQHIHQALESVSAQDVSKEQKQKKLKNLLKAIGRKKFFNNQNLMEDEDKSRKELLTILIESVTNTELMIDDPVYEKAFQEVSQRIKDTQINDPYKFNPPENMPDILFELFLRYMGAVTGKYAYPLISTWVAKDVLDEAEGVPLDYLTKAYNNGDPLFSEDVGVISRYTTANVEVNKIKIALYHIMDAFSLIPAAYDSSQFLENTTLNIDYTFSNKALLYFTNKFKEAVEDDEIINNKINEIFSYPRISYIYNNIIDEKPQTLDWLTLFFLWSDALSKWNEQIEAKKIYCQEMQTQGDLEKAKQLEEEIEAMHIFTSTTIQNIIKEFNVSMDFIQDAVDLNLDPNDEPSIKCEYKENIPDKSQQPNEQYIFNSPEYVKIGIRNQVRAINFWMHKTHNHTQEWQRLLWLLIYRNQSY